MAAQADARPRRPGLKVLGTLVFALLVGGAAFYAIGMRHTPPKPKPAMVDLGTYVTNLDDPTLQHYIKISVSVEVASAAQAKELGSEATVVESGVLAALKSVPVIRAVGPGAVGFVGGEVRRAVEAAVPGVDVLKVYFTQFIVE